MRTIGVRETGLTLISGRAAAEDPDRAVGGADVVDALGHRQAGRDGRGVRVDLDQVVRAAGDCSATHTAPSPASMARGSPCIGMGVPI